MRRRGASVAAALPLVLPLVLLMSLMAGQPAWAQQANAAPAANEAGTPAGGEAAVKTDKEPEAVEIKGIRNPELKTYRVMAAGLDAFDEHRALAPAAPELRFKLRPRRGAKNVDMEKLSLRIAGDQTSIALPLAADNTFALPRSAEAAKEDAELLLNKPKGAYRWQPDIHSAGVPAGMRRLGDLRLECQVLVATAKEEIGFVFKAMINSLLLTTDWCSHQKIVLHTASERRIDSATLIHGEQRIRLKLSGEGMGYVPPLSDKSYPDDALIEIKFADEPAT